MKLTIPRDQLITGLSRVIGCTGQKAGMSVLRAVLLDAGSGLTLSACSLDMSANTNMAADVAKPGSIALPAEHLMRVVKGLPDGPVSIESKGERTAIKSGSAVFQMAGYPKDQFPQARAVSEANRFDATASTISDMLASVAYAADQDVAQSVLGGVNIALKSGKLTIQATNRKRVAINTKAVDVQHSASCILPNASAAVLRRLLEDAMAITIAFDDTGAYFSITHSDGGGTTNIQSCIVPGAYPDVSRAIPTVPFNKVTVKAEELITLLRRISIAIDDLTPFCRFHFEAGKLTAFAVNRAFGEAEESMDIIYDGPELDIGLKPRDILDPILAIAGETVTMEVLEPLKPCIIRGSDDGFLCLLAPVPLT